MNFKEETLKFLKNENLTWDDVEVSETCREMKVRMVDCPLEKRK